MPHGFKAGGRQKGTPNRKTAELLTMLDEMGCNPIEGMVKIAINPKNPLDLRGRMYAEVAQYVYPKRKAMEVSGSLDTASGWAEILRERRAKRAQAVPKPDPAVK